MYCDFYHLTERPFNVTPDPKFLYLNARYREAIASLNYGITQRKGFITLIGEAGTGKTTLLNKLLEDLDAKTKSVFIFNTHVTFEEILEYIFAEFDLPVHNGKKLYMLQRLNSFLLEELRGGGNVALLIDEAQDLEFSVLEDLRLLSNLETAKEKILQIVLSGQPELGQKLSNPIIRQLRQRIGINCRLLPLSRDEITEYVQYRLQAAGCQDLKLFSRDAEEQIYHFSRGIPRLVNVVCDNALVIGYALGKKRIGADVITEAAADLLSMQPSTEPPSEQPPERPPITLTTPLPMKLPSRWRTRFGLIALVVLAVVVGLFSVGTMLQRGTGQHVKAETRRSPQPLEVIRPGSQPRGAGVEIPARTNERVNEDFAGSRQPPAVRPRIAVEDRGTTTADGRGDTPPVAPSGSLGAAVAGSDPQPFFDNQRVARQADAPRGRVPSQKVPQPHAALGRAAEGERAAEIPMAPDSRQVGASMRKNPAMAPAPSHRDPPAAAPLDENDAPQGAAGRQGGEVVPAPRAPQIVALNREADALQGVTTHRGADVAPARRVPRATAPDREGDTPQAAVTHESTDTAPADRSFNGRAVHLDGVEFVTMTAHSGDTISTIALREYGQASYTVLDLLKLANPGLKDLDLISPGQSIRVPALGQGFPILTDGTGREALLVYTTPHQAQAAGLQRALRRHGFDGQTSDASIGTRQPHMYRVVVTGFLGRDDGAAVGRQLQRLFREDARIAQFGE